MHTFCVLHISRTMKTRRRDLEIFSLSFLDCICCGFGAIILLFVLSKFGQPAKIEEVRQDLTALLAKREEELFVIRGDVQVLNRELQGKQEQLSREKESLALWSRFFKQMIIHDEYRHHTTTVSQRRAERRVIVQTRVAPDPPNVHVSSPFLIADVLLTNIMQHQVWRIVIKVQFIFSFHISPGSYNVNHLRYQKYIVPTLPL